VELTCVAGERRTKRDKDAGSPNSSAIRATEDAATRRSAAARRGADFGEPSYARRATLAASALPR
jgi:hypothetical protein